MHLIAALLLLSQASVPANAPQSAPATGPVTAATTVENQAVTSMAIRIYGQIRGGKVDPTLFTPAMYATLTPEILAENKPIVDQLGDLKSLKYESETRMPNGISYLYLATFPQAQFHISLLLTPAGKIAGYLLRP